MSSHPDQPETPASASAGDAGTPRVAVLVVAYEAAATIAEVLTRIPATVDGDPLLVLVADDASTDDTAAIARAEAVRRGDPHWTVVQHARNLGYGGNQKAGYRWALTTDAEVVVLLHGDAQYRPEQIPDLAAPILEGRADAVLGSRMAEPGTAKAGRMPLTRRIGNRTLSTIQNALVGVHFSEWHSGYRAYRLSSLAEVDLDALPDGFDFDTALMYELIGAGQRYVEIPIPTRYAEERSRVKLVTFGLQVLRRTVAYRLRTGRSVRSGPAAGR